jgi:hypothetical protein
MDPRNGLLLRADIHRLFDSGAIGFRFEGNQLRIFVSSVLEGSEYDEYHGQSVRLPEQLTLRPSRRWHQQVPKQNYFR